MILVRTTVELLVDGKTVRSTGDTWQARTRESADDLWMAASAAAHGAGLDWVYDQDGRPTS